MRPLLTAIPPIPLPSPVPFHASGGPSFGHSCSRPLSFETAVRSGPCHCGQSSPEAVESQPQPRYTANTVCNNAKNATERDSITLFLSEIEWLGYVDLL